MALIEIVEYRCSWPEEFAEIGGRLRRSLGRRALRINHIGSTSVPGLAAKDVIDLQVSVASLKMDHEMERAFERAGFPLRPAGPTRDHLPPGVVDRPGDWDKLMAGPSPGRRRVHVHIRVAGAPNETYALLFRDYLRATPASAATYGLIKAALAESHADDVDAYYAVKDPVCDLIMAAAQAWAEKAAWELPESDA